MGTSWSRNDHRPTAKCKAPGVAITSADRTQLELKLQRDKLAAALKKYEVVASEEYTKASHFLRSGDRRKALYCLKRRQAQITQINVVSDLLDTVKGLLDTVEFMSIQREVANALKCGKEELSKLNDLLNIEDIERLMDETAETVEEANRVNTLLGQSVHECNDDALLDELLGACEDVNTKTKSNISTLVVPTHELYRKIERESVNDESREETMINA
ncbi:hypothetical protein TRVL_08722 [Trypanosoma vivax]|nr:hypothetical protein TRVL_08722 [Trypanosoma vivax]